MWKPPRNCQVAVNLAPEEEAIVSATPASDLTAAYQWSKYLASFYACGASDGSSTVTFTTQADTPAPGTTTVTATVTGAATSKLFVNIKVTQP